MEIEQLILKQMNSEYNYYSSKELYGLQYQNIINNNMQTPSNKNLSHRIFIKQRTKELINFQRCIGQKAKKRSIEIKSRIRQETENQHETSIQLQKPRDIQSGKIIEGELISNQKITSSQLLKRNQFASDNKIPITNIPIIRFRSLQYLAQKTSTSNKTSFSVKKLSKNFSSASHSKLLSRQNVESSEKKQIIQSQKKSQSYLRLNPHNKMNATMKNVDYSNILLNRSGQSNIKQQNLKKTNATKLKLKVVDPFEKRTKLDTQFQNQSLIKANFEDSMISSLNQEEIKQLLSNMS